ncbi:Vitamin B12 ABC transporter, permease component BtuC [Croceitalea dokdonensis DOKDO 023]|uniref:Vitamin B12 ABC transporter, permease component BtuC n=1 Tax=Croceitalea dokdonensis DOKDO 023 TaxID=1300341 RepID=A0A0P7AY31_9FLAO|nr:iron ABC transporter permease [Croceitalea dokdonensis]KPM33754.1 Vitamin B12 ABC transporter, permease component BtuC [Croceitalea dokdonensis DOKDO 023]
MSTSKTAYGFEFGLLILVLLSSFLLSVSLGSVSIPFSDTIKILVGGTVENTSWRYILMDYRLPKAFTAILVGGGLAVSGLVMQTLFRNPLAGPFVLGISSGASLGAAMLLMGSALFTRYIFMETANDISMSVAASLGSFLVLSIVVTMANKVRDTMTLLIIGLMFGSITAALVSVLAYFSDAAQLQRFIFWSFGSVGSLSWSQVGVLACTVAAGLVCAVLAIKSLNALLMGELYAKSLGVPLKKFKTLIIVATGLLAGGITAFAGPIAFVGLAVPHLTRQLITTMDHRILIPAVFLYGAILMLLCDTVSQLPNSAKVLPINAITSLIGAPVVIWLLVRKRKLLF